MTPTIYISPAPTGQPLAAALPQKFIKGLQRAFSDRYSATGLRLEESDLTTLGRLGSPEAGDPNHAAWRFLASEVVRHGSVEVWASWPVREERD